MANFILTGTVEKDSFKFTAGKEPATMYGKLEVTVEKDLRKIIQGEDMNVTKLDKISLLVLKTKDEKYDGIDIRYRVNTNVESEEARLNATKILWLSLENKKPFSSIVGDTEIKDIELWLEKDQDAEQAIVEIMVLRKVESQPAKAKKKEEKTDTAYRTDTSEKTDTAYRTDTSEKTDTASRTDTSEKTDTASRTDTTESPSGKGRSERSRKQSSEDQRSTATQS